MLCKNPYMKGVLAFGCGQCNPCRINRRRLWTHRIMLESLKHGDSSFVTLTYETLPSDGSLVPKDLQNFMKYLRMRVSPKKLRFYGVGEYGNDTFRPHYHVMLFGYPTCVYGRSMYRFGQKNCCTFCDLVRDVWGKGHVELGTLTKDSAQYIAGYVTKKLTFKDDPRLMGRHPEFARMSLKPGIGALAVKEIADVLTTDAGVNSIMETGDVPPALRHGSRLLPLGRYLRKKLRETLGFGETGASKESLHEIGLQMCKLFEDNEADPKGTKGTLKKIIVEKNKQKRLNQESRTKIYSNKRGSI